jgi:RNA polymerase sigma factor (TIGR02999 family)
MDEITVLLEKRRAGDPSAEERLVELVYPRLRRLAASFIGRERPGHTLQATALVHEAYMRLLPEKDRTLANRSHFFALAARIMRQILVDHARGKQAQKRRGALQMVTLEEFHSIEPARPVDLIDLDTALARLAEFDARKAQIVELRYFGGLPNEEIAAVLGISDRTVKREWSLARAWLMEQLEPSGRESRGGVRLDGARGPRNPAASHSKEK